MACMVRFLLPLSVENTDAYLAASAGSMKSLDDT